MIENILYLAVVANVVASFYYCKDIFRGQTKPNLVTWFFWALILFIGAFFQYQAGARLSILPIFMDGFSCLVIIVFSLWNKNGYWKIGRFDIFCGIFAFLSLIFYVLTHNLEISIVFAILGDLLAAIPTIIKAWKFPKTESSIIYIVAAFANLTGLFTIKSWIFSIYSLGIYFVIMNLAIVFCIYRKNFFKF